LAPSLPVRQPNVLTQHVWGDEGKAVGFPRLTALLCAAPRARQPKNVIGPTTRISGRRPGSDAFFTQLPFRGRAATTLPDAGGSEAAVRKCCEVSSCLQRVKRRPRRRCKGRAQVPRTSPRLPPVWQREVLRGAFFSAETAEHRDSRSRNLI
jgi:hypothetical protein